MGVIIGMDPHKRSATIEVIDDRASVLAAGRYGIDKAGYAQMLRAGRRFGERVWAIEGCNGAGQHIAHRLVAELITELEAIDRKIKACKKQIAALAGAHGSTLLQLHGIGPSAAARLLADVGNIHRFASRDHFASWNGTAPPAPHPASSNATGSRGPATGGSTGPAHHGRRFSWATRPKAAPTTTPARPPGNLEGSCALPKTKAVQYRLPADAPGKQRAREGTRGRLCNPA